VVSKQWHDWVSQEDDVILELFGKSINGFILESWKGKTNIMGIPTGNSLYDNYRQFKTAIMSIKIPDKKVDFYHHVNRVLCNIQKKYITDLPQNNNNVEDKGKELKAKNDKISSSSSSDPSKKRLKLFVSKDAQSSESGRQKKQKQKRE
jgi:hypothetical protein